VPDGLPPGKPFKGGQPYWLEGRCMAVLVMGRNGARPARATW
jgi:hypothetical protein